MSKNNKERKVKGYAVVSDGIIDRFFEDADVCFYAVFPHKYQAEGYIELTDSSEYQTIIPVTISYKIPKKK